MKRRRTPFQTVTVLIVLLVGTWICIQMARGDRDERFRREAGRLPDWEFQDRSLAEVEAELGWDWQQAPPSAEHISMRVYASYAEGDQGPERQFLQLLKAQVAPEDVTAARFGLLERVSRRRPVEERPPDWFPWERVGDSPFAVPDWWEPPAALGRAVYNVQAVRDGSWVGEYLHYDADSRWLHVWEWRRVDFTPPPEALDRYPADFFAQGLADQLVREGHPAELGGWLHAPSRDVEQLTIPSEYRPAGLRKVDALLLPLRERHRYFLAFHGLDLAAAQQLIGEVPLRELPADSPPPVLRWQPFMAVVQGQERLPSWFTAGAGPRWGYTLADPATGVLTRGRWAAFDAAAGLLLVWDWELAAGAEPALDLWP